MVIPDIKEIKEVTRIIVQPGKESEVIKREGEEFLVFIAVSGCGVIRNIEVAKSLGNILSYNGAVRFDFRDGKKFIIVVREELKEPLDVIMLRMVLTVNLGK